MEYDKKIKEIDEGILELMNRNEQLDAVDALAYAHAIAKEIEGVASNTKNLQTKFSLFNKAKRVYLLAAKKVPAKQKYMEHFFLEYSHNWENKARETAIKYRFL